MITYTTAFFVSLGKGESLKVSATTNNGSCKAYVIYTELDERNQKDRTVQVELDAAAKLLVACRHGRDDAYNHTMVRSVSIVNQGGTPQVVTLLKDNGTTQFIVGQLLVPASNTVRWKPGSTSLTDTNGEVSIIGLKVGTSGGGGGGSLDHVSVPVTMVADTPFPYTAPGTICNYMLLGPTGDGENLATILVAGAQITITPNISFSGTLHVIYK